MSKIRLDILLTECGLAETRQEARVLVMAGRVKVGDQVVFSPATKVPRDAHLRIEKGPPFVSRGGEKLAAALDVFDIDIAGKICADIGASTGGFTDCLLQHEAARVYAIDVGSGILHWKLRQDPRVVVMEGTNARYVESLSDEVALVTVDASFISLKILLPVIQGWFSSSHGEVIVLIKPQFEAGRAEVSRGEGVIRDPAIHRCVLMDVLEFSQKCGYQVQSLIRSPLQGPKGNTEFLSLLRFPLISETVIKKLVCELLPESGM
ncbi:MAG: TlyA family RNA methyltransferase [Anaerolineales bacterium]|nr:TlyA family RNA methyltransferase [Anaerolineales bacterium]